MKIKIKKIISVAFFLYLPFSLFAETIILKSGKKIEGKIVEKTDDFIKVDLYGVPIKYYFDQIENIGQNKLGQSFLDIAPKTIQQKKAKYLVYSKKNTGYLEAGEQIIFDTKDNSILYSNSKYLFSIAFPANWESFYKKNAEGKKLYIGDKGDAIAFSPKNDTSVFFHIIMERRHKNLEAAVKEQLNIIAKEPGAELISSPVEITIGKQSAKKLTFSDLYSKKAIRYIIFHPQDKTTYILTFNCKTLDVYNRYVYEVEKILQDVFPGVVIQIPIFN